MRLRFLSHVLVCVLLTVVGYILFLQIDDASRNSISSVQVAAYWFGCLIFFLISWILYWVLHGRSNKSWIIAQAIAIAIAIASTIIMLTISREHEQQRLLKEKTMNQESETLEQDKKVDDVSS